MLKRWVAALAAGAALLFALSAAAEVPVPPLKARVTDLTGTLSASQVQSLDARLRDFEQAKGSQIAVLMLPSTQPETIEQYSIRVAEAWKIGRAKVDDGVILIVAKDDRRLRIEVGRGLEGAIPDAIAKRVVSDVIAPHFRSGDFYGGIAAGSDALMELIKGESLPPPRLAGDPERGGKGHVQLFAALLFAFFFLAVMFTGLLGRLPGAIATSGTVGVLAWMGAGVLVVTIFAALFAFIFALIVGASGFSRGLWGGGRWFSGGWPGGGGSFGGGGGFSGGGGDFGGGGGFSGGGGGFGGGGASGSW